MNIQGICDIFVAILLAFSCNCNGIATSHILNKSGKVHTTFTPHTAHTTAALKKLKVKNYSGRL